MSLRSTYNPLFVAKPLPKQTVPLNSDICFCRNSQITSKPLCKAKVWAGKYSGNVYPLSALRSLQHFIKFLVDLIQRGTSNAGFHSLLKNFMKILSPLLINPALFRTLSSHLKALCKEQRLPSSEVDRCINSFRQNIFLYSVDKQDAMSGTTSNWKGSNYQPFSQACAISPPRQNEANHLQHLQVELNYLKKAANSPLCRLCLVGFS